MKFVFCFSGEVLQIAWFVCDCDSKGSLNRGSNHKSHDSDLGLEPHLTVTQQKLLQFGLRDLKSLAICDLRFEALSSWGKPSQKAPKVVPRRPNAQTALCSEPEKFTSTSTEGQKLHENLAPVLVIISGKSLVFSRKIITSTGFYRYCAPAASAPVVVINESPICLFRNWSLELPQSPPDTNPCTGIWHPHRKIATPPTSQHWIIQVDVHVRKLQ